MKIPLLEKHLNMILYFPVYGLGMPIYGSNLPQYGKIRNTRYHPFPCFYQTVGNVWKLHENGFVMGLQLVSTRFYAFPPVYDSSSLLENNNKLQGDPRKMITVIEFCVITLNVKITCYAFYMGHPVQFDIFSLLLHVEIEAQNEVNNKIKNKVTKSI